MSDSKLVNNSLKAMKERLADKVRKDAGDKEDLVNEATLYKLRQEHNFTKVKIVVKKLKLRVVALEDRLDALEGIEFNQQMLHQEIENIKSALGVKNE